MSPKRDFPLLHRDLSWLRFNARVLQEAENPSTPLYERLNFLSIFSSNLDEFYAVRVAALRSVMRLKRPARGLREDPAETLEALHKEVAAQQERFGAVLRESVLPALAAVGVPLVRETDLTDFERARVRTRFQTTLQPVTTATVLGADDVALAHQAVYLACELWPHDPDRTLPAVGVAPRIGIVEVPSAAVGRFVALDEGDTQRVLFIDDVLRLHLGDLFPGYTPGEAYSVKVSRDADLYLGECHDDLLKEEFARRFRRQLRRSLDRRGAGLPTRFLYDPETPARVLKALRNAFALAKEDLVAGGRYHHLRDLRDYPRPTASRPSQHFVPQPPAPHPAFAGDGSAFDAIAESDRLLMLPYQSYDAVVDWLDEAAHDPAVERISVTLYRVAADSRVAAALEAAARNGKQVRAVVELKARFDEANNLGMAERLEAAGVRVYYTACNLKVHAKLLLVERRTDTAELARYAYLSTGNFNEQTARVYTDYGLFTAHPALTDDVVRVFGEICDEEEAPVYHHLLVAPRLLRRALYGLIEAETARAKRGEDAWLFFKMNSLEDRKIIRRLYEASQAGVKIRLLVRGICRLLPGVKGLSENIEVRSIVGRYLEHGRAYLFGNGGDPLVYLGSADLMRRNLSRRVEVLFPVLDQTLRDELARTLALQWRDTQHARFVDANGANLFVTPEGGQPFSSQQALYERYAGTQEAATEERASAPLAPALFGSAHPPQSPRTPRPARKPAADRFPARFRMWLERHPLGSSLLVATGLLLLVPFASVCERSVPTQTPFSRDGVVADSARGSFLPKNPDARIPLVRELTEISGHTFLGDTLIAAIQDEDGAVFFINPRDGRLLHTHQFGAKGDYEDIAYARDTLYVLRSDGDLYVIPDWRSPGIEAPKIETPLKGKCDAEGLAYDASERRLLIACKERPGTGNRDQKAIYAFDLDTRQMRETPAYTIGVEEVAALLRDGTPDDATSTLAEALDLNEFKPSALAFHPHNDYLYVVASRPRSIVVLRRDGTLLGAELLPESYMPQPEGIAFRSDGDMYLSSEAVPGGTGFLEHHRYLKRPSR